MVVIFGATGRVGGAAATELVRRGARVRAVVRDAARGEDLARMGCELAVSDLGDRDSVERALRGATAALVLCPLLPRAHDPMGDAARVAVTLGKALETVTPATVVALSDYGAHLPAGTGITLALHRFEQRLRTLPTATTLLRSAEHMENWARQLSSARERGVVLSLHHPVTRRFPIVAAADVGHLAAEILAEGSTAVGRPRVVHVEGPRRYSAAEIAAVLEGLLGRKVVPEALPRDRWVSTLAAAGLARAYAQAVAELQDLHNAGGIDVESGVGEVRRGSTELAAVLAGLLGNPPVR